MDNIQLQDEAVRDRIRLAEEFLDRKSIAKVTESSTLLTRSQEIHLLESIPFSNSQVDRYIDADDPAATVRKSFSC